MVKKKLQNYLLITALYLCAFTGKATEPFIFSRISNTPTNYYSVFIMDTGECSALDLASMLEFYNPNIQKEFALKIAKTYIQECLYEGVNHDIAFCQMVLETGFLCYGGSVQKYQNNFCGLGATSGKASGEIFPDMQTGIRAHIQHLKAYASRNNIIKKSVDKRFRFVQRGTATTIYALTGKWASDPQYDTKIENLLIRLFTHRSVMAQQSNLEIVNKFSK